MRLERGSQIEGSARWALPSAFSCGNIPPLQRLNAPGELTATLVSAYPEITCDQEKLITNIFDVRARTFVDSGRLTPQLRPGWVVPLEAALRKRWIPPPSRGIIGTEDCLAADTVGSFNV